MDSNPRPTKLKNPDGEYLPIMLLVQRSVANSTAGSLGRYFAAGSALSATPACVSIQARNITTPVRHAHPENGK
jgi:hypothetical protein